MKGRFFKDDRGQAMVELALVLPILLILFMGVIEFGRVYHSYLVITNASREGARVAILGGSDDAIKNRVGEVTAELDQTKLQTVVTPVPAERTSGKLANIDVQYQIPLVFPPFDIVLPNPLPLSSITVMRVE